MHTLLVLDSAAPTAVAGLRRLHYGASDGCKPRELLNYFDSIVRTLEHKNGPEMIFWSLKYTWNVAVNIHLCPST